MANFPVNWTAGNPDTLSALVLSSAAGETTTWTISCADTPVVSLVGVPLELLISRYTGFAAEAAIPDAQFSSKTTVGGAILTTITADTSALGGRAWAAVLRRTDTNAVIREMTWSISGASADPEEPSGPALPHTLFAGPSSGTASGEGGYRYLVPSDLPGVGTATAGILCIPSAGANLAAATLSGATFSDGTLTITGGSQNIFASVVVSGQTTVTTSSPTQALTLVGAGCTITTDNTTKTVTFTVSGAGLGDVTGPSSAVSGNIATYNGTTGKIIQDGGVAVSALMPKAGGTFSGGITGTSASFSGNVTGGTFTGAATGLTGTAASLVVGAANLTGTTLASGVLTSSLTAVGTIASGSWAGTAISVAKGGTGGSSYSGFLFGNGTSAMTAVASTGTGSVVLANSPTLLGTITLGSVIVEDTGISGVTDILLTGGSFSADLIAGSLTGNRVLALPDADGTVALVSGNLGTPTTLVATNLSGTAASLVVAAGNLSGTTLPAAIVGSSLTAVGTISSGSWAGTTVSVAKGGTGATSAAGALANLGGTTAGQAVFTLTNPSAVTFLRVNADNTVTARSAANFRTDLGLGTGSSPTFTAMLLSDSISVGSGFSVNSTGNVNTQTVNANILNANDVIWCGGSLTLGAAVLSGGTSGTVATTADLGTLATVNGGTGVATALAINVGSAGAFVVLGGALGTPSSGTLSSCIGYPAASLTGTALPAAIVTSSLTAVGTIVSGSWAATTISVAKGGTGATSLTGVVIGNGTSAFTVVTAPSGTIVGTSDTQTLTNKRITPRVQTTASTATLTASYDSDDQAQVTAQAASLTLAAPGGTPTNGQKLIIRIKDNGTSRSITFDSAFRAIGVTLPSATTISKTLYLGCIYNSADSKTDVVAVALEA